MGWGSLMVYFRPINNQVLHLFQTWAGIQEVGLSPSLTSGGSAPLAVSMASKLNPNVLYVAEHAEALGSPQADSERTSMVSEPTPRPQVTCVVTC